MFSADHITNLGPVDGQNIYPLCAVPPPMVEETVHGDPESIPALPLAFQSLPT